MPDPVQRNVAPATPAKSELTHKITLNNGNHFSLLDPARPGNPWVFKQGVETKVPESVAMRLKETAVDRITVRVGKKSSLQLEQKFSIDRIGGNKTAEDAQE